MDKALTLNTIFRLNKRGLWGQCLGLQRGDEGNWCGDKKKKKGFCVPLSLQGPVNICLSDFCFSRSYLVSISSDVVSVPTMNNKDIYSYQSGNPKGLEAPSQHLGTKARCIIYYACQLFKMHWKWSSCSLPFLVNQELLPSQFSLKLWNKRFTRAHTFRMHSESVPQVSGRTELP